ncbi:MAG: glycosyltransferase, partial [Acidimicrobiales bacterium]|nr:glycosyltransferase [Acidimicrobiales bacterium]
MLPDGRRRRSSRTGGTRVGHAARPRTSRVAPVAGASIVVCTRNRADRLGACLAHLADQTAGPAADVEVVVVDNGST